jgi:hypothetical protein
MPIPSETGGASAAGVPGMLQATTGVASPMTTKATVTLLSAVTTSFSRAFYFLVVCQ